LPRCLVFQSPCGFCCNRTRFSWLCGYLAGQFKGKTFITLKLIDHGGTLAGTCVHTTSLEKNSKGELTQVGETQTEDPILEARLKDSELLISVADNGNVQQPLQCVVRLTGKNEGELQIVGPGDAEWKPWKIERTASH
jgi:hypothetical protein